MTTNSGTSSTSTGSFMIMDKALRPERLEVLPNSKDSAKTFKHWKMTFEHYAAVFPESSNRLHILINLVAPEVYDLFCQDATYEEAITTLTNCYIKQPNEVYARHLLATRKQQPGESFDAYLNVLKSLSKDCNFKAVSADVYANESIRDAFINGTSSTSVRQRLLEKKTVTLDEMVDIARSLESAEKNAESYLDSTGVVAATGPKQRTRTRGCWNCGNARHPRSSCPARNNTCKQCNRTGHYDKMCKSKSVSAAALEDDDELTEDSTSAAIFVPKLI